MSPRLIPALVTAALLIAPARAQQQTAQPTTHHFYLYENGGGIEITTLSTRDKQAVTAIRQHLARLMNAFAAGDFSHHIVTTAGGDVPPHIPGSATMQRLRDRIAYTVDDIPSGGRLRITTRHVRALAGIHEFLRFQITENKTGDSLQVSRSPGSW